MILHFDVILSLLIRNLVATATKAAEVSALFASSARSVLHCSLFSHDLTGPSHHHPPCPLISCSYPGNFSDLIPLTLHSQTSFKTHRS